MIKLKQTIRGQDMNNNLNLEDMQNNFYEIWGLNGCKLENYKPNIKHEKNNSYILERLVLNDLNSGLDRELLANKYRVQLHTVNMIIFRNSIKLSGWSYLYDFLKLLKNKYVDSVIREKDIDEIIPNYGKLICLLFSEFCCDEEINAEGYILIESDFIKEKIFRINIIKHDMLWWQRIVDAKFHYDKKLHYKCDILNKSKTFLSQLSKQGVTNLTAEDIFEYLITKYEQVSKKGYRKRKR